MKSICTQIITMSVFFGIVAIILPDRKNAEYIKKIMSVVLILFCIGAFTSTLPDIYSELENISILQNSENMNVTASASEILGDEIEKYLIERYGKTLECKVNVILKEDNAEVPCVSEIEIVTYKTPENITNAEICETVKKLTGCQNVSISNQITGKEYNGK